MNRADLQNLSLVRRDEALLLFEAGFYSGAFYLSGYAVECALKASIASATRQYDFPEKSRWDKAYTHDLNTLVRVAGIEPELRSARAGDPLFEANWKVVSEEWSEGTRYAVWSEREARDMLSAITGQSGVLEWIIRLW